MKSVTTHEAKTHLSKLLAEVEGGEEVLILRGTVPAARLVRVESKRGIEPRRPKVGTVTAPQVQIAQDAFAPLRGDELALWGL